MSARATPATAETTSDAYGGRGSGTSLPAVWVNGERLAANAAHLSAFDRGVTLADGVFETLRVYHGAPFLLERHLARIGGALRALDIDEPSGLRSLVLDAVHDAGAREASVRLSVTRGTGAGVAPPPASTSVPTVVVLVQSLPLFPASLYERGLSVHVVSGRRNGRAMTAGIKTLAYTDAVAALIEARRAGADDALFLDTDDHCSEAASSNLFVLSGGVLVTPPLSCGALPGITRGAVLELAAALGVPAAERPFGLSDLLGADEAFLTSSLRELAPLVRVDGVAIGTGTPGAVTRALSAAYADLVRRECGP